MTTNSTAIPRLILGLALASCAGAPALAAIAAPPDPPTPKVDVRAKLEDYDPRRDDTASKTVMSQEEIRKYGDTNVFDVLKRAPGVTVVGNSIRMRGLGNGYTQVLVNGERPPPGFSLEALPPDQIERIEIVRAAMAEFSMQAISGTVNIVLKKAVSKPQKDLRLTVNRSAEKEAQYVNGTLADKNGGLSWYLNAGLQHTARAMAPIASERFTQPDGHVSLLRDWLGTSAASTVQASLGPRLNWKLPDDGQLNLSASFQAQRSGSSSGRDANSVVGGRPAPDYVHERGTYGYSGLFGSADVNWVTKLWGGKLDAKLGGSGGGLDSTNDQFYATAGDAVQLRRLRRERNTFPRMNSSGKYTRSLLDGHALAAGWEIGQEETRIVTHRVEGIAGQGPRDIDEEFAPRVLRRAAFVQDEWSVTRQWSVYLGTRWEGIRTRSSGTGLAGSTSNTVVLSPVAQTLYKFPDKRGRQLRLALTHTFKAPDTNQLSARRWEADTNTRFSADYSGNPALLPEQADGFDLTYEYFWAPGAVFSVGTSTRRIRNLIREVLEQEANGRWLLHPVNDGNARVRTVDVDLKLPLKALVREGAPPIDLRFNLNRNWSVVDTVPGPGNRLDQQIPLSIVLGIDYKRDAFGAGCNVAYRSGGTVRISPTQRRLVQARRDLDAYVQYSPHKALDLRVAIANALHVDNLSQASYEDAAGTSETFSRFPSSPELRFNLGLKF